MLVACGGSSGGTAAAPTTTPPTNIPPTTIPPTTGNPNTPPTGGGGGGTPNPLAGLANFMPTDSTSLQAVQEIVSPDGARIDISDTFETGNLNFVAAVCAPTGASCNATLPESNIRFQKGSPTDISLILNNAFFSASSYSSEITNGITIEDITFARGNLTGTRASDNTSFESRTFSGWLDGSIFGTTQITVGASGSEQYRFISYNAGIRSNSNPEATGMETSATWEGATVASIKDTRTFIRGDATITVTFADSDVDLMFDNWRNLDNEELSSMEPIAYSNLMLIGGSSGGRFLLRNSDGQPEVFGRFYGTGHEEVGGWFNTRTVTEAFGGTRQTGQ